MLALARALAVSPKLIIADEMSLGLAPLMAESVFEGLEEARRSGHHDRADRAVRAQGAVDGGQLRDPDERPGGLVRARCPRQARRSSTVTWARQSRRRPISGDRQFGGGRGIVPNGQYRSSGSRPDRDPGEGTSTVQRFAAPVVPCDRSPDASEQPQQGSLHNGGKMRVHRTMSTATLAAIAILPAVMVGATRPRPRRRPPRRRSPSRTSPTSPARARPRTPTHRPGSRLGWICRTPRAASTGTSSSRSSSTTRPAPRRSRPRCRTPTPRRSGSSRRAPCSSSPPSTPTRPGFP